MKYRIKYILKSALSIVLAMCMLVSCMTVGIIATDAAKVTGEKVGDTSRTIYIYPADLWSDYASYTIKVNVNIGDNNTWRTVDFTNTGKTINGKVVYTATFSDKYDGVDTMQIQKYQGSTWKDQKTPFSSYTSSSNYDGKIYNGSNWATRPDYDSAKIKGITGDWGTSGEIDMTLDSGNNYYYAVTGDGNDKYYRLRYGLYYDAHENNFDLVNGSGAPYDGSTDNKKYGLHQADGNAFKLPTSADYNYRIYFDISGKKTWFTKTERTHSVAIKRQLGSGSATNVSTSTIGNVTGVNVTANASVSSGGNSYSFDHWLVSGDTISYSTSSNGTYTSKAAGSTFTDRNVYVKTAADNVVLTAVYTKNAEAISAPSIKMNNGTSDVTTTASKGDKVSLTWAAVTNAGSYEVYKGTTKVATTTGTSYSIERGYSYSGAYTVVAVPSDTDSYSNSDASNSITLTVNKVKLNAPTVAADATEKPINCTFTFSITNTNTSYTAGTDYKYQHTGAGNSTYADVSGLSWTTGTLTSTGNKVYKFKATAVETDYFSNSDEVSVTVKACAKAKYSLTGDMVTGQGGETGWPTAITTYPVDTFVSENVFYRTVTVSGGSANDKHYFRLTDQSNQFTVTSGSDTDMSSHDSSSTSVTASTTGTNGAMYVTGNGNFKIYVDQSTSSSPKVWVVSNEWSLSIFAYYQSFNLATDSLNAAVAGTSGGTVSGTTEVIKGQSTTLTATPASGYTFDGWYTSADFTSGTKVSNSAAYTFTPSANGNYYALFKENTPAHYNVSVSVNNTSYATVTATYKGNTISTSGSGTLSVPVGASVTYTITPATGCQIDSRSPSGLITGNSGSFTMPSSATTVSASASKINYTITGVKSPNYGTLKFYSTSECTTVITTAQYNQTFYAKYTSPSGNAYALSSYSISGTGSSKTATDTTTGVGTFKMGTANVTVTATLKAATPSFTGTWPTSIDAFAGEQFTYTAGTYTPSGCTVSYTFNGSTNSTGTFTAPATAGTKTMTITLSNKPAGISTAATVSKSVTVNVKYHEKTVTYYVDMHNNSMSGKTLEVAIVSNGGGTTVLKNSNNQDCKENLEQQGSSTVYAAAIATPVTKNGTGYSTLYVRIKYGTDSKVVTLNSNEISTCIMSDSVPNPEIWIEARNEAGNTYKVTYSTNSTTAVSNGNKRIYLAKPYDWQTTETDWKNIKLYHWGDYADIGWNYAPQMTYIGCDSEYHYYYIDVSTDVNNIIFQGWKDNSSTPDAQTGNIENIGSSNYFILSKDGNAYTGTKGETAAVPGYTRYTSSVALNVGESANIAPTHTGASVTYSSSDTSKVSVDSSGVLTAVASTFGGSDVTVTVKIFGTVGAKATSASGDYMQYTFTVSVRNPGVFNGYNIMSFAHQEYTVSIPAVGGDQPGYFDLSSTSVIVNGLYDGSGYTASYANSAIITEGTTVSVTGVGTMPTSFKIKYAASDSSKGYSAITLNDATVITKSIRRSEGERYGFKQWNPSQASAAFTKVINNGVETATHKGLAFTPGTLTYQAEFVSYTYVDVTFTFKYDEYVPEVVTVDQETQETRTNYQYDAEWAAKPGSHETKTYTVTDYEVREYDSSSVTNDALATAAAGAIEVIPKSNYYDYSITAANITKTANGKYKANATVNLTKTPREYKVYLNGTQVGTTYKYQEYVTCTVSDNSQWYATTGTETENAPLLATNTKEYRFRVKGNTYLRTNTTAYSGDFNRSEVGFSHYEVTHRENAQHNTVEYLYQNYYIADFFDINKFIDESNNLPYDDVSFVGGGVVYYSVTNGTPYSKAVDAGYVNNDGTANASEIKAMLKRNIEAKYNSTFAGVIGEEDAMKVAYGTEIPVTNNEENGAKTGVLYRYLPLEKYSVDGQNNITTTPNNDVFRYSNTLQAYQYVYASGNENKVTNNGKNMRLYSYYIYSYLTYDKETNVPVTKYEIILSDNYSDASTYWNGVEQ